MSGIAAARWLASLAPPRRTPTTGAAERGARAREQRRGRRLGVHARPQAHQLGLERDAADLARDRVEHAEDRGVVVGAQVADELAAAGHDVERVAGVQHGGHRGEAVRAVGRVAGRDRLRGGGEREQRVAAAVGRRAGVRGAARARAP